MLLPITAEVSWKPTSDLDLCFYSLVLGAGGVSHDRVQGVDSNWRTVLSRHEETYSQQT